MTAVFDASAVLAILKRETGAERAFSFLPGALISSVNVAEILARLIDHNMAPGEARHAFELLRLKVRPFDQAAAIASSTLRQATRATGLSLGDRACLALAYQEKATAITADRAWSKVEAGCEIVLIR